MSVCVNTLPSRRLSVAALELDVTTVLSSVVPLSNPTTPFASDVTTALAFVKPNAFGNATSYVALALCGGLASVTPCELFSQFKTILPEFVLPRITTLPVPLGARSKSAFDDVTMSCPFVSKLAARPVLKFNVVPTMVVNAPVLAEFAPIAVPSIAPEFMSIPG